ncbi:MAG: RidA family protein [Gemmatimonadaceae bacterium]
MLRFARTLVCTVALGLIAAGCSSTPAAHTAPQFAPVPANSNRAFSPFVRANGFLYLAGQLGTDSTGKLAPGGIKEETRQTMMNIKSLLERNGSSMDRVVRCLVLLADINDRPAMSDVYVTFFAPDKRPVRTAAGVGGLALNGRVEIECIATE